MTEMSIRHMEVDDLEEVMRIDRESFSSPWTQAVFMDELRLNKQAVYFVVETKLEIVGYVGMWIVYEDAQITNIAISKRYRGYGIGEKLFGYAIQHAIQQGAERLSLEVRVSNEVAQNMYSKFGLVEAGIRKNYYTDDGEDALVMWVNLK